MSRLVRDGDDLARHGEHARGHSLVAAREVRASWIVTTTTRSRLSS
jgi:hypothetical protein